jgi:hypothetical protein
MSAGSHTADRGNTWNPTIDIDADVHQVAITRSSSSPRAPAGSRRAPTAVRRGPCAAMASTRPTREPSPCAVTRCSCRHRPAHEGDGPRSIEAASAAARSNGARLACRVVRGQHRHLLPRRVERRLVRGVRDRTGMFGGPGPERSPLGCPRSSTCSWCPTEGYGTADSSRSRNGTCAG